MRLIMVLLMVAFTTTLTASEPLHPSLNVQMKDGSLIFHIQGSEEYHDAVVMSKTGSNLGATQIASNLWKSKPAHQGTFSAVLCDEASCTLIELDWECIYFTPRSTFEKWFSAIVTGIAVVVGTLFIIISITYAVGSTL